MNCGVSLLAKTAFFNDVTIYNFLATQIVRIICAKNYEKLSKYVKVTANILSVPSFLDTVYKTIKVKVKERIVLPQIYLRTTGRHLSMGSHRVICHPTEVTATPSPQPHRLVLDLSTP